MKQFNINWIADLKRGVVLPLLAGVLMTWLLLPASAKSLPEAKDRKEPTKGEHKTLKFGVLGDHRGDNDPGMVTTTNGTVVTTNYTKLVLDPATGRYVGFKDGGINQVVVAKLAAMLKNEEVEFVLDIGDLVTKWIPQIDGKTADELLTEELALWANIWKANSGCLPIYPVRGNQEWTASKQTWLKFTRRLPGIGELRLNGPEGEQGLTYGFHDKNCLFIGIDHYLSPLAAGDVHVITPAAQAWLNQVLAESDKPFKFVYGHAPAFEVWNTKKPAFTATKDGLANPAVGSKRLPTFTPEAIAMRDAFWNSIGMAGAEYFCGHEHIYARGVNTVAGRLVRQTIIGNGGAPSSPAYDPSVYPLGPFAESYVGKNLQPDASSPPYVLTAPLIVSETSPRGTTENGYVVVTVNGSHVVATYKSLGESWTIVGTPDRDEADEHE